MKSTTRTIENTLLEYRQLCEQAWYEETASPKLRPIAGKPLSTGQCSATSLVLRDVLNERLPESSFKLVLGSVHHLPKMENLIPLHVWLHYYTDPYSEPMILDITADQSKAIQDRVIFESPSNLIKRGILYHSQNILPNLKAGTHERATLLRALIDANYKNT